MAPIKTWIELLFKHLGSRDLIEYVQVKHTISFATNSIQIRKRIIEALLFVNATKIQNQFVIW